MSGYDAWAPVYDAWASDMTEDVPHYVALAREANGSIVELMVGMHLHGWQEKLQVLERVARSLRPGGRFAFNTFVFSHRIAARLDGTTQDESGVLYTVHYAPADNRVDIVRDDGATIHLWWATRSEWEGLLEVAGLEVEALYGGFRREPYTDESLEMVWVVRRPAA